MTSREIDALVAEKVAGWTAIAESKINGALCGTKPDGERGYKYEVPRYSTDIAAAWQVVEKLMGDQYAYTFTLRQLTGRNAPGKCWAVFKESTAGKESEGYGPDAPTAICLAALKAVEKS